MPITPPLCPAGSRDVLLASHRTTTGSPAGGYAPYLRSLDIEANVRHARYYNFEKGNYLEGTVATTEQVLISPEGDYVLGVTASSAAVTANRGDTWGTLSAGNALVALPAAADATCYKAAMRLSPDHQYVYMPAGGAQAKLNLYKVPEMAAVTGLPAVTPSNGVHGNGCWSPDGTKLATISSAVPYFTVRNWPSLTTPVATQAYASGGYQDLAFSADGTKLAAAHSTAGYCSIWNVATMTLNIAFPGITAACHRVELTPDGLYWMFASLTTGQLYFVDTTTHAIVADLGIPSPMVAMADARFSTDGKYLLLILGSTVRVYLWATKELASDVPLALSSASYCCDAGPIGHSISNEGTTPVRDAAGNPIAGVAVTAHHRESGGLCGDAVTDADGRYTMPVATTAPHTVLFKGSLSNEASVVVDWVIPT